MQRQWKPCACLALLFLLAAAACGGEVDGSDEPQGTKAPIQLTCTSPSGSEALTLLPLSNAWKFRPDPKEEGLDQKWFAAGTDTAKWATVRSDKGTGYETQGYPDLKGYSWYRQTLFVPKAIAQHPRLLMLFCAADAFADIFINGEKVFTHNADNASDPWNVWRVPFVCDAKKQIKPGTDSVIAVRIYNVSGMGGVWKPAFLAGANQPVPADDLYALVLSKRLILFTDMLVGSPALAGKPSEPEKDLPSDKPREHVEVITRSPHEYRVSFKGNIDGVMTRGPIGYGAFTQGWQPNRSLLIENIGTKDIRNPWVLVNGRPRPRSLLEIVEEATRGYSEPSKRARAIWEFFRRRRFHFSTRCHENKDAVKLLHIFGYGLCGNCATVLSDLWREAGFHTRKGSVHAHSISDVQYDGDFHLLDGDEHIICLEADHRTLASSTDIAHDHDLMKRTHAYGILRPDNPKTNAWTAGIFCNEKIPDCDRDRFTKHVMQMTLRPGESLDYRWDHVGKQYTGDDGSVAWLPKLYSKLCNGKLRYRPDLASPVAERGAVEKENVAFDTAAAAIRSESGERPAIITWRFGCPYMMVGGRAAAVVQLGKGASAEWLCTTDQGTWKVSSKDKLGKHEFAAVFDKFLSRFLWPTHEASLTLILNGEVSATGISFEYDFQAARLSLPEVEAGKNTIQYADENANGRKVRITHRWMERRAWHQPRAPKALFPKDGQVTQGSGFTFRWSVPRDPDGGQIVDYHFELSEHKDLRWPLSPNFEKLISKTAFKGKAEWTPPRKGLLNGGATYYWHVRALDEAGVWSPWSKTYRFTVKAPGVPLDVKLVPGKDEHELMLTWQPNPEGEEPTAYKVYGSDEKGFTISDTEHAVYVGKGVVRSKSQYAEIEGEVNGTGMAKWPANLVGTVQGTSVKVVGPDVALPNTNKCFFRVVAVEADGNESGPSDYAQVERPFVYTRPRVKAQVGKRYRYDIRTIETIGNLSSGFRPPAIFGSTSTSFTATSLPPGLTLGRSGPSHATISGIPTEAGTLEVRFQAKATGPWRIRNYSYRLVIAE